MDDNPGGCLVGGALITAGVVAYVWICLLLLTYVTVPLSAYAGTAGALAGLALTLGAAGRVLLGHSATARPFTSADFLGTRVGRRVGRPIVRRDNAWPQYFVAQVGWDLAAVATDTRRLLTRVWAVTAGRMLADDLRVVTGVLWPLVVPVAAALVAFTGGAALGLAAVAALFGAVTLLCWLLGVPVALLLRAADRSWQVVFRSAGSCVNGHCNFVTRLPAYRCPGAHSDGERGRGDDLHRDIRPGLLGVLWRRCRCGRRLPTTVLRASRALSAHCPACHHPLHRGAATATDIRVPVFGASSAGKTYLIMAAMYGFRQLVQHRDVRLSFADPDSQRRYDDFAARVTAHRTPDKTARGRDGVVVTMRVRPRHSPRDFLIHVYDASGEDLVDTTENAAHSYLDAARTMVFVLDPFSIPQVRDKLTGPFSSLLREANPAMHPPEDSYQVTVTRLHGYGVDTTRRRLAFVLSKADLMGRLPPGSAPGQSSASVRDWLCRHRLENLVAAAERDFGSVEYFFVSAKDTSTAGAYAPFRWLFESDRMRVS